MLFALLAFVARPTAGLSRAAVRLARSQKGSSLRLENSGENACIEVAMPVRGWPRRAVLAAAMRSDAEFIVFRRPAEQGNPASLIALARDTGAFAVAKQSAYSAWRKTAVRKHPFRRLQPGEVSEVFAPFSSLLVIRRTTLLRLGVPRALTYGGALSILFWKAAAAGLRNLVLGHEGVVTDEPAMALEDAELGLRLTVSRRFAQLRPARPARYRGNVSWSPSHSQAFRNKPRVLVVSPYLPFPLSHGGAVRIYNLCRSLAGRVDFVLACFHEANEKVCYDELHEVFREVYVVDVDEKRTRADELEIPAQVAEYRNAAMSDLIRTLCTVERKIDLVQLEYTQMAEYRDSTGAVPTILVEHDITFTLYRQLAEFNGLAETHKEFVRWREFERAALQCSNIVWTMSAEERSVALDHGGTHARTRVVPNGVDIRRFKPAPKPEGPPVVLFVGSFRHLPNLLAFEALRTLIMPEVWRECPEAELHVIAGPQHEKAAELAGKTALLAAHPHIVIEGFVPDVRPAYRDADVVAVSLPLSAGTNIKLLEAMACGRAIVSTASGCRGLDLTSGTELIVAELDASFAAGIVTLLRDENLRTRMAAEARWTAERRFGWHAIAEDALQSYVELIPELADAGYLSSAEHAERSL
jgi:glycosyltransferase involved in cell wall biosynthesis